MEDDGRNGRLVDVFKKASQCKRNYNIRDVTDRQHISVAPNEWITQQVNNDLIPT